MSGHGHVKPNADGSKTRCGGPPLCPECARELAQKLSGDKGRLTAPRTVKQYSYAGLAGCVALHLNRRTGTLVGLYHAEQAMLDASGGAWVTVCEEHGTVCNHDTLALARAHLADPAGWCAECPDKED